jgi:hypothetical protein
MKITKTQLKQLIKEAVNDYIGTKEQCINRYGVWPLSSDDEMIIYELYGELFEGDYEDVSEEDMAKALRDEVEGMLCEKL